MLFIHWLLFHKSTKWDAIMPLILLESIPKDFIFSDRKRNVLEWNKSWNISTLYHLKQLNSIGCFALYHCLVASFSVLTWVVMLTVTVATLTDLGFLWFREFYLESSRVIQVILITYYHTIIWISQSILWPKTFLNKSSYKFPSYLQHMALQSNLSLLVTNDSNHQMMIV